MTETPPEQSTDALPCMSKQPSEESIRRLMGEAREILEMATDLMDHRFTAEAIAFALTAAQRLLAIRALKKMHDAARKAA